LKKNIALKKLLYGLLTALIMVFVFLISYQQNPLMKNDSDFNTHLKHAIQTQMTDLNIPGVQITLFQNNHQTTHVFGYRDVKHEKSVDDTTIFRAQSMTKTLTAVLILKLVELGQLDLHVPISTYLPQFFLDQIHEGYHHVTIHQILKHQAHMPLGNFHNMYDIDDASIPSLASSLIEELSVEPHEAEFLYSNTGYNLLEYIINQIDANGYNHLAKTLIFTPLHLTHTSFYYELDIREQIAFGYDQFHQFVDHYRYPELGSGGLLTTSSDYATFLSALLTEQIINHDSLLLLLNYEDATNTGVYTFAFDGYGYGTFIESSSDITTMSHGGQGLGYMAFYHVNTTTNEGYVLLSNSQRTYPLTATITSLFNTEHGIETPGIYAIYFIIAFFNSLSVLALSLFIFIVFRIYQKHWIQSTFYKYFWFGFSLIIWFSTAIILLGHHYLFIHVIAPQAFERFLIAFSILGIGLTIYSILSFVFIKQQIK